MTLWPNCPEVLLRVPIHAPPVKPHDKPFSRGVLPPLVTILLIHCPRNFLFAPKGLTKNLQKLRKLAYLI